MNTMLGPPERPAGDIRQMFEVVRRRKLTLLTSVLIGSVAAWLIYSQLTPRYEAEATVALSLRNQKVVDVNEVMSDLPREQTMVRTEMEVVRSRSMAERVVDRLHLTERPDFLERHMVERPLSTAIGQFKEAVGSWISSYRGLPEPAKAEAASKAEDPAQHLVDIIQDGVSVTNDGQSFTLNIRFVSPDPNYAAEIANAYAESYLTYQVDLKNAATREAHRWLKTRIDELASQLNTADAKSSELKQKVGIVDADGQTTASLELQQLNQQLVAADAHRIEVNSRLAAARNASEGRGGDASPESLNSQVVVNLRQQLAAARSREAGMAAKLGTGHPQYISARDDRISLEREIAAQTGRIMQGIANEAHAADVQVASLKAAMDDARKRMAESMDWALQLRQLDRDMAAGKELHENYLLRMKQLDEQEQLQVADASIISRAQAPLIPTYPSAKAIALLGIVGGLSVGGFIAFVRERLDDGVYSADEIERLTALPVLGLLPSLPRGRRGERLLAPQRRSAFAEALRVTGYAVSFMGPAVRSSSRALVQGNYRRQQAPQVIAVTSAGAGEGKTTFCAAISRHFALHGRRVLLVSADVRRPRMPLGNVDPAAPDLTDVVEGRATLKEAVGQDVWSSAHYLAPKRPMQDGDRPLSLEAIQRLLGDARQIYDVIVVDTPPVNVVSDTVLVAREADACLFFVRWGRTQKGAMLQGLRMLALCGVRMTGVVLAGIERRRFDEYSAGYMPSTMRMAPGMDRA